MIPVAAMIAIMTGISGHHLDEKLNRTVSVVATFRDHINFSINEIHMYLLCRIVAPHPDVVVVYDANERIHTTNDNRRDE